MALDLGELVLRVAGELTPLEKTLAGIEATVDKAVSGKGTKAGQKLGSEIADGVKTSTKDTGSDVAKNVERGVSGGSGAQAGRKLGDEIDTGAKAATSGTGDEIGNKVKRDLSGKGKEAGSALGGELGRSINDSLDGPLGDAVSKIQDVLGGGGGAMAKGAKLAGAGIAGALIAGLVADVNAEEANAKIEAQLGLSEDRAAEIGKTAGELYSDNFGDSIEGVNEGIRNVILNIGGMSDASDEELQNVTANVLSLAQAFDQDLGGVTRAVGQLMRTGLAQDANQAMDIVAAGFQRGLDSGGDFLDTINEYSTQFRDMGLSGEQALGILQQGLQGGARDADIVADSLKELNIRIKDKSAADALSALGLNADQMADAFARGGPKAREALDQIFDRLRSVKDPADRAALAVQLMGTQAEDLAGALEKIDPSAAVAGLGDVAGAAQGVTDALGESAMASLMSFVRALGEILGYVAGPLLPLLKALGDVFRAIAPAIEVVTWPIRKLIELIAWVFEKVGEFFDWVGSLFGGGETEGLRKIAGAVGDSGTAAAEATPPMADWTQTVIDGSTQAEILEQALRVLSDAYDEYSGKAITSAEAQIRLTEGLAALREGWDANGNALDLNTEAGANNMGLILDQITAAQDLAKAKFDETGSIDEAKAAYDGQIGSLAETLRQMGLTEEQIAGLIAQYATVPDSVYTDVIAETATADSALNDFYTKWNGTTITYNVGTTGTVESKIFGTIKGQIASAYGNVVPAGMTAYEQGGIHAAFANGGEFQAGQAQVFPPGLLRWTGDRAQDDEFYIPDNDDPRSMGLLGELMRRRGITGGGGGAGPVNLEIPIYIGDEVVQVVRLEIDRNNRAVRRAVQMGSRTF